MIQMDSNCSEDCPNFEDFPQNNLNWIENDSLYHFPSEECYFQNLRNEGKKTSCLTLTHDLTGIDFDHES